MWFVWLFNLGPRPLHPRRPTRSREKLFPLLPRARYPGTVAAVTGQGREFVASWVPPLQGRREARFLAVGAGELLPFRFAL